MRSKIVFSLTVLAWYMYVIVRIVCHLIEKVLVAFEYNIFYVICVLFQGFVDSSNNAIIRFLISKLLKLVEQELTDQLFKNNRRLSVGKFSFINQVFVFRADTNPDVFPS